MALWNNLKLWLAGALAAGSLMMPNGAKGDNLQVYDMDGIGGNGIGGSIMTLEHIDGAQEGGPDGYDADWASMGSNPDSKWLKMYTDPYSDQLCWDSRPSDSDSTFQNKLSVVSDSGSITITNKFYFEFLDGPDSTRHYTANIHCDGAYTPSGNSFDKRVNIRDVINNDGGIVNLPGITNVPNGTVYGTCDVDCKFNRLVSTKTGNGTNSFEGSEIVDYEADRNVALNANPFHCVKQYILTRTDNIGNVNVTTNDVPGQTNYFNVAINDIKGSNALHAVYDTKRTSNGVAHTWYAQNGMIAATNTDAQVNALDLQDKDGDGMNNLQEYISETNPTNKNSYFIINNFAPGNSLEMNINPSSTSRLYSAQSCTNLLDNPLIWTNEMFKVGSDSNRVAQTPGNGSNLVLHLDNTNTTDTAKFYRARVRTF